jgi:hypothetical protein
LIVTQDGTIGLQVPITPTPRCRVEVSLASEVDALVNYQPLGWHQHLHLLLGHSQSTYHCLTLQPEALPRPLPADVEQRILYTDDPGTTLYGARQLAGGRVLLVFRASAVVLGPGATAVSGVTSEKAVRTCLLGTTPVGSIAACDERDGFKQRDGFVKIQSNHRFLHPHTPESRHSVAGEAFSEVATDGTRLFAGSTEHDKTLIYDASSDPGIRADAMQRRVLHWLTRDGETWAAVVIVAYCGESTDSASSASTAPTRYDLRIIGRADGHLFGWTLSDVERHHRDVYPRIAALSHGLLGMVRNADIPDDRPSISPYDPRKHRVGEVVLFDFLGQLGPNGDSWILATGNRVGTGEDRFYLPVVEISPEWVLILGPLTTDTLPWAEDAVFRVYQYRVGSLEAPSLIAGLTLSSRVALLECSAGRVDLREVRLVGDRTWAYVRQLGIDNVFGVRFLPQQPSPVDLGLSVHQVVDLDTDHIIVAYSSVPFRIEVRRLHARQGEELPVAVAVGYLAEPPRQMMVSRGPTGVYLVVATESDVIWFNLESLAPGVTRASPA